MKSFKLIIPVFALMCLSQMSFAQQTKPSEIEKMGVDKQERMSKKEAATPRPTNSNDKIVDKKVHKKEKTVKKQQPINEDAQPELHKDGRYPQQPATKSKMKFRKKKLQIKDKTIKQANENQSVKQ